VEELVHDVEVLIVHTGDDTDLLPLLSAEERARAARLTAEGRREFVVARAALRDVLGAHLGLPPPAVPIVNVGKPCLAAGELEFSVAHAGDVALIALARALVGIDIERVEPIDREELAELAEFVLSERERRTFLGRPASERLLAYYRAWTQKEAYLKATGEGISGRPLTEIEVEITAGGPRLMAVSGVRADVSGWSVLDLEVVPGYVGAAVVAQPEARVAVRDWER
jgi:4'-phosphopantetheinyl transferase